MKVSEKRIIVMREVLRSKGYLMVLIPDRCTAPFTEYAAQAARSGEDSPDIDLLSTAFNLADINLNAVVIREREATEAAFRDLGRDAGDEHDPDAAKAYADACRRLREAEEAAGLR